MEGNIYKDTEHLKGTGSLFRGEEKLLDVEYDIRIHEGYVESDQTIMGLISAENPQEVTSLATSRNIYTLELEDGRKIDVYIADNRGTIEPVSVFY